MDEAFTKQNGGLKLKNRIVVKILVVAAALTIVGVAAAIILFQRKGVEQNTEQPIATPSPSVTYSGGRIGLAQPSVDALEQQNALLEKNDLSGKEAAVVVKNELFEIVYFPPLQQVNAPSEYSVEILGADTAAAKAAAEQWFLDQGLTKEAVCQLNVSFWLSGSIKETLQTGGTFNMVPSFCQ